jgi:hypothetical protein
MLLEIVKELEDWALMPVSCPLPSNSLFVIVGVPDWTLIP